jgi:hypothetical protein
MQVSAVLEMDDLVFTVENRSWTREPEELTDFFTSFYISVKNRHHEEITIVPDDIFLLDGKDNQFDVVSQDFIEQLLLPHELEFNQFSETGEDQTHLIDEWRKSKQNLITYSFHFGKILPGAVKSGFIFYPKLELKNKRCSIVFQNNKIEFIRSDQLKKELKT